MDSTDGLGRETTYCSDLCHTLAGRELRLYSDTQDTSDVDSMGDSKVVSLPVVESGLYSPFGNWRRPQTLGVTQFPHHVTSAARAIIGNVAAFRALVKNIYKNAHIYLSTLQKKQNYNKKSNTKAKFELNS